MGWAASLLANNKTASDADALDRSFGQVTRRAQAEALISIAYPDFRERQAYEHRLIPLGVSS